MIWAPSTDFRYVLRKGMRGTDVGALQLNLGAVVDGDFGPQTKQSVDAFQAGNNLTKDGIAGLATQQALCVKLSSPAARNENLPAGLLKSLMANESGFAVGAVTRHPSDNGLDVGAYQRSTGSGQGTQHFFAQAYDVKFTAQDTAAEIRAARDGVPKPVPSRYLTELAHGDVDRFKWLMAVENHNWPVAAHNIPRRGSIFVDAARDDQRAEWVVTASGGRLTTPREWVHSYIQRATVFVRWP